MDVERLGDGGVRVACSAREAVLLRTALERAAFLDTPPHLQGPAVDFAEALLRKLGAALPGPGGK